jgi:hypothetical protein
VKTSAARFWLPLDAEALWAVQITLGLSQSGGSDGNGSFAKTPP